LPELVPPPPGGDALVAWQQFVEKASREYAAALKLHCSKCDDQGYNGNPHWAEFSRNREIWLNTLRKKRLAHASRLLTLRDQLSTRKQQADELKNFAAKAMSRIKVRAGRPLKTAPENTAISENVSLVPAISQVLIRGASDSTTESDQVLRNAFSAFDKDGNRQIDPGEAFRDSPLFVMARYFDLDGKPKSVSDREWLLIAKATILQVGGNKRGFEACHFLLAGPEAIKMHHRLRDNGGGGQ
jgi:hypothetical protein